MNVLRTLSGAALAAALSLPAAAAAQTQDPASPRSTQERDQMHDQMRDHMSAPKGVMGEDMQKPENMKAYQSLPSDQRVMVEAYMGNHAEVKLGELAEEKAQNPQVKQFAQTLQQDHGKANETVQQYLESQDVAVPRRVSKDSLKIFTKLTNTPDAQFDKTFINAMVKEHKRDIDQYQKWQKQASNQQVKDYLSQTLPVLKQHLQQAQQIQQSLGGKA